MAIDAGWLTAGEARARLGVNERTLRKWAVAGRLRRVRERGGRVRFWVEDVERLLHENIARVEKRAADGGTPSRNSNDSVAKSRFRDEELDVPANARAREQLLLQEIEWLRAQIERLHDTHREFCLLLLQSGRGSDGAVANGPSLGRAAGRDGR